MNLLAVLILDGYTNPCMVAEFVRMLPAATALANGALPGRNRAIANAGVA
jgi:hypothetical protein